MFAASLFQISIITPEDKGREYERNPVHIGIKPREGEDFLPLA
jgi:hypothetical protein